MEFKDLLLVLLWQQDSLLLERMSAQQKNTMQQQHLHVPISSSILNGRTAALVNKSPARDHKRGFETSDAMSQGLLIYSVKRFDKSFQVTELALNIVVKW